MTMEETTGWNVNPGEGQPATEPALDEQQGQRARVELVGNELRVAGDVDLGRFTRLSDFANFLEGFFELRNVVFLTRLGKETEVGFPELRVRLDDISIVGQPERTTHSGDPERVIPMEPRRLVVTTAAHIVHGSAYLHAEGSLQVFIDMVTPAFMPMTDVRVLWLSDHAPAASYPFALLNRRHIVGVAGQAGGRG